MDCFLDIDGEENKLDIDYFIEFPIELIALPIFNPEDFLDFA
jgi:hypothetical protein